MTTTIALEPLTGAAVGYLHSLLDVYAPDVFSEEMAAGVLSRALEAVKRFPAAPTTPIEDDGLRALERAIDSIETGPDPDAAIADARKFLAALRSSPAVDGVGEPVAWGYIGYDGLWVATRIKELADAYASEGTEVTPLYTRSALSPTSDRASVVEAKAPDRDSIRLAQQFVDQYKSGAQGAEMDADSALSLAMAIADILAALSPRSS